MAQKQNKYEPSPRWVRVKHNGETIADSKNPLLVWEGPHRISYYFPRADVRMELLEKTGRGNKGRDTMHIRVGDRVTENAAWSYSEAPEGLSGIEEYIAFRWNKIDHWFEEEEEIFVHPRDPYHRVDTVPSSRHIKVVVDGVTVAESERPFFLFETGLPTRYYLPPEDVRMDLLTPTDTQTACPYKGTASYWSVTVDGKTHKDIVWGYPAPIEEIPKIKGALSFYNEKVDIYVDREQEEKPASPWS
jgi:uncharacterized protein (DUF427 family)